MLQAQAQAGGAQAITPQEIAQALSVESIFRFIDEQLDPLHDPIEIIRQSVAVNTAISEEGMLGDYGLQIGKSLEQDCQNGYISRDLATHAMIAATAGADARMAGAPLSVVANSGSGNQGITTTMRWWQPPAGWAPPRSGCYGPLR